MMRTYLLLSAALCSITTTLAHADSVSDFYQNRNVSLIVGFPPGGGYDANMRVLSRHIGKRIPGEPTITVSNMPGAGSLTAANFLARSAPRDGTALAMFSSSAAMEAIFQNKAATFDPQKFSWLGSMSQEVTFCGVWQGPNIPSTFAEMMKTKTVFGSGGTAAITYQHPMVLRNVLGANVEAVTGYAGTRDINLAMNRGEVNGSCGLFESSISSQWGNEVKTGQLKLVIQMGAKRTDSFGPIPSVYDFAKSDEQRAILDVHFKQLLLARPVVAPPDVPADRLAALRKAFVATLNDPAFRADSDKLGIDIDYVSPEAIQELLASFAAMSPDIRQKALAVIGR